MSSKQSQGSTGGGSEGGPVRALDEQGSQDFSEETVLDGTVSDDPTKQRAWNASEETAQPATKRLLVKDANPELTVTFDKQAPVDSPDLTATSLLDPTRTAATNPALDSSATATLLDPAMDPTHLDAMSQNFDEVTHIVQDDELAAMRVETGEVDLADPQVQAGKPPAMPKIPAAPKSAAPTSPMVSNSATAGEDSEKTSILARAQELRAAARVDAEESTDDVTDVTVDRAVGVDASEILASRMEQPAGTGVGLAALADDGEPEHVGAPLASPHTEKIARLSGSGPRSVPTFFDDDVDSALAEMVRQVGPRPPTRLAALGSSIVLLAVMGLWVAGDPNESHGETASAKTATAQPVAAQDNSDPVARASDMETPAIEDEGTASGSEDTEESAAATAAQLAAQGQDRAAKDLATEAARAEAAKAAALKAEEAAAAETAAVKAAALEAAAATDTEMVEMVFPDDATARESNDKPAKRNRPAAEALYKKASMAFMQGKLTQSEQGFKSALKEDSSFAMPHRGLGLVYERRGYKAKAAASLRRYLRNAPRAPDAKAIRARLSQLGK